MNISLQKTYKIERCFLKWEFGFNFAITQNNLDILEWGTYSF